MSGALTLGELIAELEQRDPAAPAALGFTEPHSWRGSYSELAFSPEQGTTVGAMLADARSAVGATYEGWKGGDFTMDLGVECYLAEPGEIGEPIGRTLLRAMLGEPLAGTTPLMVARRVGALRGMVDDPEAAHLEEDRIRDEALRAIADGTAFDPQRVAAAALATARVEFARWSA